MTGGPAVRGDGGATITVPGSGSVRVEPDVAALRLGVVTIRPTAAAARSAAATTMRSVVDSLIQAGVDRRDLRTTLVNLDAVRDYSAGGTPTVTGYQLTTPVEATIRAIDTVGGVIDAALAAGATSLDGLGFQVAEPGAALTEARRLAVADARGRAETLAAEAGVTVGHVLEIVEGGAIPPGPPRPMAAMRMAADVATPVEAGSSELVIQVTVTFAIA